MASIPVPVSSGNILVGAPGTGAQTWIVYGFILSSVAGSTITLESGPSGGPSTILAGPYNISADTVAQPFATPIDHQIILCVTNPGEGLWIVSTGSVSGSVYTSQHGPKS